MRLWLLWLRNRWQGIGAAVIALLALLFIALIGLGGPAFGVSLLGNAGAPRAAAANGPSGTILPRSGDPAASPSLIDPNMSILDTLAPTDAGPQTVAAAQAAWSADAIKQRQNALLSAINCARQQQKLPVVTLDPQLSETAGAAWLRLVHDPAFSLMKLPGQYTTRSVLTLAAESPSSAATSDQARPSTGDADASSCSVDGFDPSILSATSDATQIGIAVFPPQASWDMASAVVLVK